MVVCLLACRLVASVVCFSTALSVMLLLVIVVVVVVVVVYCRTLWLNV